MIEETTRDYLAAVDEALPGFVEGFYLVGSAALGAWQPGVSDIDTVVFAARVPSAADLATLRAIHASVPVDGVYLPPELARAWPADRPVVPFVVDGTLQTEKPCGELTPVLWLLFRTYGIPLRGPSPSSLGVRVDADELRRYNLDNLRSYWQSAVAAFRPQVGTLPPTLEVDPGTVVWFVLGPARLHHTVAFGDIISKAQAGRYLASQFPAYAELAERVVRHRSGDRCTFTAADLLMAADAVDAVAEDAWRRFAP